MAAIKIWKEPKVEKVAKAAEKKLRVNIGSLVFLLTAGTGLSGVWLSFKMI